MATVKAWFVGLAFGALALFGALSYRKGRNDQEVDARLDDYENAEDIRRSVSVDRDKRMREYDDSGWRD